MFVHTYLTSIRLNSEFISATLPTSTMPVKLEGKARLFNASGIAASYVYLLDSAFSPLEKQAAARAVLRYNQHTTNHSETRTDGGLHPMYLQLHGLGSASEQELKENKRLLEASQSDLFDAVSFRVTFISWYL